MNTQNECPICMEIIDFKKNCVTTECGHCFHTNCLMTSVAHNGFGCPYCRTLMAEGVNNEDEDEEEEEDDEDDEDYEDDDESVGEDMFNEISLRGFRFFMNNVHGESHEQEDLAQEEQMENIRARIQDPPPKPSSEFIAKKLIEDGVTMEQLVKVMLLEHEEYDDEDEEYGIIEGDVFGKLRTIITNYEPEEQPKNDSVNRFPDIRTYMSNFVTHRFNRVL